MRTAEDFARAVEERRIDWWPLRGCSICGYMCGYRFLPDGIWYDAGCYCTGGGGGRDATFEDLAYHYNRQSSAAYIATMDEFWGWAAGPTTDGGQNK